MRLSRVVAVLALAMSAAFAGSGAANAADPFTQAHQVTIVNCENRLEDFVIGTDDTVGHRWQNSPGGPWTNWVSMGGTVLPNGIDVGRNGDCKLELFAIGTNHAIYTRWQTKP